MERYITVKEIGSTLSMSRATIYRCVIPWLKANCLKPFIKQGKMVRFREGAVVKYVEKHSPTDF